MGSDKEDLARWADLVLDGKPINIDQTIRQQAARIADLEEAVLVLAVGIAPLVDATDGDDICLTWDGAQNVRNAMANPIAAEAVRRAGG
jgi:hypothetical protein